MKRFFILALALVVSASFLTVDAGKKDKKKKKAEVVQEVVEQPVAIVSSSDSVSYAAGVAMTNGLIPYLKQQYQFDEVFMDDFISGFKEAMKLGTDPQQKARMAGMQIAQMVNERMLPNAEDDFKGTPDSIQAQMFQQGFIAALQKDTTHFNQEAAEQFFSDHRVNALKKATDSLRFFRYFRERGCKHKAGIREARKGRQGLCEVCADRYRRNRRSC